MYKTFWDDIWSHKNCSYYVSKTPTTELPWETYTHDIHLEQALSIFNNTSCRVLELGCGSGYDAKFLSQKGHKVTAIDISEAAIEIAKKINNTNNISYRVADIITDSIDDVFDLVYDRGCLHNLNKTNGEWELVFSKLHKNLVEKGKVILITGNTNQPIVNFTVPTPVSLSDVDTLCKPFFKVLLANEINFKMNSNYYDSLGWIFVLEKIN